MVSAPFVENTTSTLRLWYLVAQRMSDRVQVNVVSTEVQPHDRHESVLARVKVPVFLAGSRCAVD